MLRQWVPRLTQGPMAVLGLIRTSQGTQPRRSRDPAMAPSHDLLAYLDAVEEARAKINSIVANSGKGY